MAFEPKSYQATHIRPPGAAPIATRPAWPVPALGTVATREDPTRHRVRCPHWTTFVGLQYATNIPPPGRSARARCWPGPSPALQAVPVHRALCGMPVDV